MRQRVVLHEADTAGDARQIGAREQGAWSVKRNNSQFLPFQAMRNGKNFFLCRKKFAIIFDNDNNPTKCEG